MAIGAGFEERHLTESEIRDLVGETLAGVDLEGKRVLVIIPDSTRSGPIGLFFRLFHELMTNRCATLDFLIALGTHQPMTEEAIHGHLGVTRDEMAGRYSGVRIFNHHWEKPDTFRTLGVISADEISTLSRGMMNEPAPVTINKRIFDYDRLIVCGLVFPYEVAGFSGGNKYFFPGISGAEIIDITHWLGALITSYEIIGTRETPVRAVIDRAASLIDIPKLCFSLVVREGGLAGLFAGTPEEAWRAAADLSAKLHIRRVKRPFQRVLSIMPEMYDDIWTAAKGMYKLEPVAADGGEVIIYAPHITEISYTHGRILDQVGYHVRDYFVKQWERFREFPRGVLAHSTHLCGNGTYENGVERPRVRVTLATGIPRERCERLSLEYRDPATIDPDAWAGREDEGTLVVPHAGEMLYRLRD